MIWDPIILYQLFCKNLSVVLELQAAHRPKMNELLPSIITSKENHFQPLAFIVVYTVVSFNFISKHYLFF